jgi:hypothetical protein
MKQENERGDRGGKGTCLRGSRNRKQKRTSRYRPLHSNTMRLNRSQIPKISRCAVCHTSESPKYKCPRCSLPYCSVACCTDHKESCSGKPNVDTQGSTNDNTSLAVTNSTGSMSENHSEIVIFRPPSRYLTPDMIDKLKSDAVTNSNAEAFDDQSCPNENIFAQNNDYDNAWKITAEMIQEMDSSLWLKEELNDVGLQLLIRQVVTASKNVEVTERKRYRNTSMDASNSYQTGQEHALAKLKAKFPSFQQFIDRLLLRTGILELSNGIAPDAYLSINGAQPRLGALDSLFMSERASDTPSWFESTTLVMKPLQGRARKITGTRSMGENEGKISIAKSTPHDTLVDTELSDGSVSSNESEDNDTDGVSTDGTDVSDDCSTDEDEASDE